jgi:hypothetical protein
MKIESWGGEIAEIGAIYPIGGETIMVLIGLLLWVLWFVVQARMESREYREEIAELADDSASSDE